MTKNCLFVMMKHLRIIFMSFWVMLQWNCARIGSPTGGPTDSIPPVMAIAKPTNKTSNFKAKKVEILFDEYIKFKNLNTQLIISPPMETRPIIKPEIGVSKKISIKFLDTLKPNTTYTINFGNSIIDNNEGNELGKFSYVFSTGSFVDSLSLSGKVLDPLQVDKEIENISILAYKNANDTLVGCYTPDYLTNTLDSNAYTLENLSESNYKIIALEDKNNNYVYDKGKERIGFLNEDIQLKETDSIDHFILFKEPKDNKVLRPTQTNGNVIIIGYQGKDLPEVSATGLEKKNYLVTKPTSKDTLYFWFKKKPTDSIYLNIKQDTMNYDFARIPRDLKIDSLTLNTNNGGILHPNDSIILSSNNPIELINKDSIVLLEQDSIPIAFTLINKINKHQIFIDFQRKINKNYSLILKELAFTDILNTTSKKKIIKVKTIDPEEYGEIIIGITNPNNLKLLVEISNNLFLSKTVTVIEKSQDVNFKHLTPGEYQIRIIKDLNKNSVFDNGNFTLKTQPEPVYNFEKKIKLRANYLINETIDITKIF